MIRKKSLLYIAVCFVCFGISMVFVSSPLAAFPEKPIRMIVPFPPGGNTDINARAVQNKMSENIGQRVIIENRGGAGGTIGSEIASRSAPDGYTILMVSAAHVINPSMVKNIPYDTLEAFDGIAVVANVPSVLLAHPSLPYKTLQELIAYAKSNPGKVNYASSGHGTIGHLAAELMKSRANIDMVHVPYRGNAPAMIDLLGGHVDIMFSSLPSAIGHIRSGKLVAIALSAPNRSPAAPEIATMEEQGLTGCEVVTKFSLFAPAGTPKEIIEKLNGAVVKALQDPNVKAKMENLGAEPVGSTPEELDEFARTEIEKWKTVSKSAGIEPK
jgi:tripartite-type tricarboxylate transporter receptor subunit TctC